MFTFIWFNASRSEARNEAERFLRQSAVVEQQIGEVQNVSMYPLSGWHISEYGVHGNASVNLVVNGTQRDALARIELVRNGVWRVKGGTLTTGHVVTPLVTTDAK
jgi:hypothetical protein